MLLYYVECTNANYNTHEYTKEIEALKSISVNGFKESFN